MSKSRKEDKPFSGTEVGTLIESFRNDISVIAEDVSTIRVDMNILKRDVRDLKKRMISVDDVIRVFIPKINSRASVLEAKVG
ncbi:MAG: hypothetical protein HY584_01265 [Candidatus Omnitrophica bacterium]|nr:hypothetical protein [Candidatus Omnitrophota bacterium]